ncbi:MgtA domain/ATPase domain-containing protein [Naegleria gruberi]|uniref:Phospholipid-transporting ATPase n=1 Tax=Naegleria gruberi TaxID=5762 RepID=D2W0N6_NAEGR|nr:MgtA domain/ATPase domain-containing protein [Naegleria gruberi]EFC37321.1 MgtA domain/ATPase domain-containing protein [Naegleria gruberi]|eukprot:XP_002670065.1 MgtA domain/ATPase domain-containing protein [Naegleria gruberi strain NEG-M]
MSSHLSDGHDHYNSDCNQPLESHQQNQQQLDDDSKQDNNLQKTTIPTTTTTVLDHHSLSENHIALLNNHHSHHHHIIQEESLYIDGEQFDDGDDYVVKQGDRQLVESAPSSVEEIHGGVQEESISLLSKMYWKVKDKIVDLMCYVIKKKPLGDDFELEEKEQELKEETQQEVEPVEKSNFASEDETERKFEKIYINNREENRKCRKPFPKNSVTTTKYSILTFIPKNLFEQFRKAINVYLLLTVIAVLIPDLSPMFPPAAVLPITIIVLVQMAKDGFEDFQRYRQDRKANNEKCRVIRDGILQEIQVKNIEIGDVVSIKKDEVFPADLLCIHSSREDELCYIETANLDGETNLKSRRPIKGSSKVFHHDVAENNIGDFAQLKGKVQVEMANNNLDVFEGMLKMQTQVMGYGELISINEPLTMENLLLRGCTLRNTQHIFGIAIYLGKHTKIFMNTKENKVKRNELWVTLNKILVFLVLFQQVLCAIVAGLQGNFHDTFESGAFYLAPLDDSPASFVSVMSTWVTTFILLNYIVNETIIIGFEAVKTFQSWDIQSDAEMRFGDIKTQVRTANLNQALSSLDFIFSDKTGTLTQNEMKYSDSWTDGMYYSEKSNPGSMKEKLVQYHQFGKIDIENQPHHHQQTSVHGAEHHASCIREFLTCLTLNNSVMPEKDLQNPERINYNGPSSDEIALLEAATNNGFKLIQRTNEGLVIDEMGETRFYEIIATFPFTSDRKRMTVLVKTQEGRYIAYVKGADNVMLKRCRARKEYVHELKSALLNFSVQGLRTLVIGRRELSMSEFETWFDGYNKASMSSKNRGKMIAQSASDLEIDLELVGCTAIEDKLQDDVAKSIDYLSRAGLKIWVLTGDKTETAINIAYSTNVLVKDKTIEIRIRDANTHQQAKKKLKEALEFLQNNSNKGFEFGLIIDSKSLEFILDKYEKRFIELARYVHCAVCCRLKPLQKSSIVKLIESKLHKKALSIGDGVNDVAMIQAASIGVGIQGKEGSQASRSSDFSIPRFKNLVRLLAVHGRNCSVRNADFLHLSFYKNFILLLPQFFNIFYCGYSGTLIFDSWELIVYIGIYFFFQPIAFGSCEKDLPEEVILEHPELYDSLKKSGNLFNLRTLIMWGIAAIYHALVIFFGIILSVDGDFMENGPTDLYHFGKIIMTCMVCVVTLIYILEIKTLTVPVLILMPLGFLFYFAFNACYSPIADELGDPESLYIYYETFVSVQATLTTILVVVVAILPNIIWKAAKITFFPSESQRLLLEYLEKKEHQTQEEANKGKQPNSK